MEDAEEKVLMVLMVQRLLEVLWSEPPEIGMKAMGLITVEFFKKEREEFEPYVNALRELLEISEKS